MSSASFLIFVIWKNEQLRIMINLTRINTKLYFDAYFLSKQNTILSSLKDSKRFFQQKIELKNWWKIIFVTFHRGLEWLTISNMKLKNVFDFFQSRMKKIFDFYLWQFVFVYMNDIIVYFRDTEIHLRHFDKILKLLKKFEMTLILRKCHFVYFSIKTLKHWILKLNFNILKKKFKRSKIFDFRARFEN